MYKMHHNQVNLKSIAKNIIKLQLKLHKINLDKKNLFDILLLNFRFFNDQYFKFLKKINIIK